MQVDLTSNFFVPMYQHESLFILLFIVGGVEPSMNIHEGND